MTSGSQTDHLELAGPEDEHVAADWEAAAAAVLRRAGRLTEADPDEGVWAELARTTLDGIQVTPLGTPALTADLTEELLAPPVSGRGARWDIRPVFANPDPAATAAEILTDLENGATSVWIQAGPIGVPVAGLGTALGGVLLDAAPVILDAPGAALEAATTFAALAEGKTLPDGSNLGVDPIGVQTRGGAAADLTQVSEAAQIAVGIGARALVVDGSALHDRGASDGQELGYAMAVAATYLRALEEAGHDATAAAGLVEFRLAATDEQFPTIAKFRAARRLWARMLELSGVATDQRGMRLHAVTSRPMMSKYDASVNMLRTCVASFAAGVGGADAVTVLPFDMRLGLPDALARRVARNTSSLLIDEAHVAKVTDPGAGSFAVERLTHDLAAAGWAELDRIESAGGILAALTDGSLEARVDAVVAERDRQVAVRRIPLTGLSEFPTLAEALPKRAPYAAAVVAVRPYGHAFEALRNEPADAPVFLATMGKVAAHTARASFATNLFAAGGVSVVNRGAHESVQAVLASYEGQQVVCLTGADGAYQVWGAELVAALRSAGARWVVLAGEPGEQTVAAELVDDSAAVGVDALAFLTRTREQLS